MFGTSSLKITVSISINVWLLFCSSLITSSLPGGSGRTKHRTSDTGHIGPVAVCWSHTYYVPCRATQMLNSGTEWTRRGSGGARLCSSNQRVRYTLVSQGRSNWLVSMTVWAGREVKPIRLRTRWSVAGPVVEELAIWGEGWKSSKSRGSHRPLGPCEV